MEHNRLAYLLEKHHQGECSKEESEELESWYQNLDSNGFSFDEWVKQEGGEEVLANDLFRDFKSRVSKKQNIRHIRPLHWALRIAAGFVGTAFLLGVGYRLYNGGPAENKLVEMTVSAPDQINENRYFILPDSSKVLLHAGSKINYSAKNKETREVNLSGEAYFEVKPDRDKPFIIHTGKLKKTTVLGTAFNIRAYSHQDRITVTVTHGKVQVENESKVLGILTKDQEIVYNSKQQKTEEKAIRTESGTGWISAGMEFESVSLKKIAEQLSRRYGIKIRFDNPSLEGCPITASFRGTETFSQILDIITITRGATYRTENNGKDVVIEGEGCMM